MKPLSAYYRAIRRILILCALLMLAYVAINFGLWGAFWMVVAFIAGVGFASLNYLEEQAKAEEAEHDADDV